MEKKNSPIKIVGIVLNYFDSRNEVIITAKKEEDGETETTSFPFGKEEKILMHPRNMKWYVGDTKYYPITRKRSNCTSVCISAKLIDVNILICRPKFKDDKYDTMNYCTYAIVRDAPVKRSDMLTREEVESLINKLIEKFPEVFSRDSRFSV